MQPTRLGFEFSSLIMVMLPSRIQYFENSKKGEEKQKHFNLVFSIEYIKFQSSDICNILVTKDISIVYCFTMRKILMF